MDPDYRRELPGRIVVFNIAWGYEIGGEFAHVITNMSPFIEG